MNMEDLSRPYRARQGGWERGGVTDKTETWRIQEQGRGQTFRYEGSRQSKNQCGPYRPSPKMGDLGSTSYSPGLFRGGNSPSQMDDVRWFSGPDNSGVSREDNWRERMHQQHWRSGSQEGQKRDREQGRKETNDDGAHNSGEELN